VLILHLDLKLQGNNYAELRYFWDNRNQYSTRKLPLCEISELIQQADVRYYTNLPDYYPKTGQTLYNWLDGTERLLQTELNQHQRQGIVLAISAAERLAHLPWEILHDGEQFLVQRTPAIIPVRWVADNKPLNCNTQPNNRALNLLFMASSPRNYEPVLDFEAEEGRILEATKRTPLYLEVEESGCLEELGYLVKSQEREFFDVVHLTGHATFQDGQPCFITETEYGDAKYSTAAEIASTLQFQYPKLIFLSGCRTGYSRDTVSSMAEALLRKGAMAVLAWGERVLDTEATIAAATLYQGLSCGSLVTEALAETYQKLIQTQAKDWHLLRLYVAENLPGALVTPPRTGKRKPAPRYQKPKEFRDEEGKLRVVNREDFVGRRRQLQKCLQSLKTDYDKVGVLLHGMGGLGKSTIASRLWERLPEHEKLCWWRQIDEPNFVKKLAEKLSNAEQRTLLQGNEEELKYRLRDLFEELTQAGEKPFLFVLDDFEWNLEPRQGRYILKPEVKQVLNALIWAIQDAESESRIIITCRYKFESELLQEFWVQGLDGFRKSDLQKKLNRLEHFKSDEIDKNLIERSLNLADGNPRLLEFINDQVLSQSNIERKLNQLETHPEDWKEKIIWSELYELIDKPLERVLSHCLIFEIPVPREALEAVCESLSDYQKQLERAIKLGLIEVSSEIEESDRVYRVSRILPRIISSIKLPEESKNYEPYRKGLEKLQELWGDYEKCNKDQLKQLLQLLFADKDNSSRFREGFYKILNINILSRESKLSNRESERIFEAELRKVKADLSYNNLYTHLEDYLQQQQWKEADIETTWIFFQVMVIEGFQHWGELVRKIPSNILNQIDELWVKYSDGDFGFSVQKQIWENIQRNIDSNDHETLKKKLAKEVGWYREELEPYKLAEAWIRYENFIIKSEYPKASLPAHYFARHTNSGMIVNINNSSASIPYINSKFDWMVILFSSLKTTY
jgi:CHAT domain-containing protein